MSSKKSSGISPIHIPGSVTRNEARNLYYGEDYDRLALAGFSLQLLNSICIGRAVSIYTDDEELLDQIKEVLTRSFGKRHIIEYQELNELKIHGPSEQDKPYIVLFKFLLWLCTYYETVSDEGRSLLQQILRRIRNTNITMYLVPGERAKYRTILLPKLEFFFTRWIDKEKKRRALIHLRDNFYNFSSNGWRAGKDVQKIIEVFTNKFELLCHDLLKYGVLSYEALREMINIIVDLQRTFKEIPIELSFVREMSL